MTLIEQPLIGMPVPDLGTLRSAEVSLTRPDVRPVKAPNGTLLAREDVTDSMAAFTIALDSPVERYRPGQYVSLGIVVDGALVQRPYSIVALDGVHHGLPRRVELFIRRVPGGALSSRLWQLPIGARVHVGTPKGLFVLDQTDRRPRLFIGTGTGLAPLLAMLDELVSRGDDVPSALVHGVSYRDELAYGYRIAAWMASGLPLFYRPAVSRSGDPRNEGWRGLGGRADVAVARVLDEMPALRGGIAYLCGNSSMIESCSELLRSAGLAPADIRAETFHGQIAAPAMSRSD